MKRVSIILASIITFTLILITRTVGLDKSPVSVGFDEAALGYNSYSLLTTGKDEYGVRTPLSLRSFNDYKPALYAYLAIPFIQTLGLNETSTRLPSAIAGVLALFFLLLIHRKLQSKLPLSLSLLSILIVSFYPWRLHFSRVAFESNLSMAFFSGVVLCLLSFDKRKLYKPIPSKTRRLSKYNLFTPLLRLPPISIWVTKNVGKVWLIIFSVLSVYSYHSSRLAIPLLILLFLLDPLKIRMRGSSLKPFAILKKIWPIYVVLLFYIPLIMESNAGLLLTRYNQTNLFSHYFPFTPDEIRINQNVLLNPIGHPLYYLGAHITGHLLSYVSPKNLSLLIYPGVIKSAQAIAGSGMIGFTGGLLFIFGLHKLIKYGIKKDISRYIFYWLFAGILPAAITWEWYYPLRSLNSFPAIDLISIFGLTEMLRLVSRIKSSVVRLTLFTAFFGLIMLSSVFNLVNEFKYGAWQTAGEFQPAGFKEGALILGNLRSKYPTIYIDSNQGQSYELLWFYLKYPPDRIQAIAEKRNKPGVEGPSTLDFDNFVYKKFDWPSDKYINNFAYFTNSEVKEEEIRLVPEAKLIKIIGTTGDWIASIITKD